jgi:hypothetical protein
MNRISPTIHKYLLAGIFTIAVIPSLAAQTHKSTQQADWQIENKVQKTLTDEHAFVGSSIFSSVNKGVVTLTGNVRSEAEKSFASSELANITGIKTVLNNLNIVDHSFHEPPPPKPVAGPSGPKVLTLPDGTTLSVRLGDEIDTKTAKPSDIFHGTTANATTINGYTLIPQGRQSQGE